MRREYAERPRGESQGVNLERELEARRGPAHRRTKKRGETKRRQKGALKEAEDTPLEKDLRDVPVASPAFFSLPFPAALTLFAFYQRASDALSRSFRHLTRTACGSLFKTSKRQARTV